MAIGMWITAHKRFGELPTLGEMEKAYTCTADTLHWSCPPREYVTAILAYMATGKDKEKKVNMVNYPGEELDAMLLRNPDMAEGLSHYLRNGRSETSDPREGSICYFGSGLCAGQRAS